MVRAGSRETDTLRYADIAAAVDCVAAQYASLLRPSHHFDTRRLVGGNITVLTYISIGRYLSSPESEEGRDADRRGQSAGTGHARGAQFREGRQTGEHRDA